MPINPSRKAQGGDVEGTTMTDSQWSIGSGVDVSKASFDPGYDTSLSRPDTTKADLLQGYCSYGRSIGEPSGPTTAGHDGRRRQVNGRISGAEDGIEL